MRPLVWTTRMVKWICSGCTSILLLFAIYAAIGLAGLRYVYPHTNAPNDSTLLVIHFGLAAFLTRLIYRRYFHKYIWAGRGR